VIERAQTQWKELDEHIQWCNRRIAAHLKDDSQVKSAMQLTGVGPVTASAVVATVGDFKQFKNGAQFGAWLGLTPMQNSSGGKTNLGGITKQSDMYVRMMTPSPSGHTSYAKNLAGKRRWWPWLTKPPASSGLCLPRASRLMRATSV
jgi:transposase